MNSAEKLTNIFSEYLDEEQMEIFNQNLVKNFSLQNVVESITILNPDKLLDEVEQAVGRLQKITGRKDRRTYHDRALCPPVLSGGTTGHKNTY